MNDGLCKCGIKFSCRTGMEVVPKYYLCKHPLSEIRFYNPDRSLVHVWRVTGEWKPASKVGGKSLGDKKKRGLEGSRIHKVARTAKWEKISQHCVIFCNESPGGGEWGYPTNLYTVEPRYNVL